MSVLLALCAVGGCGVGGDGAGPAYTGAGSDTGTSSVPTPTATGTDSTGSDPAASGSSGTPEPARSPTGAQALERGVVTRVVDGDTIDVAGFGRIRLIGIDTPERGACGFDSATLAMHALVFGREVTLIPGARDDRDRFGRLLRFVEVDGIDVGLRMIEEGWAIARYDSRDGFGAHHREQQYIAADAAAPDLGCYPD